MWLYKDKKDRFSAKRHMAALIVTAFHCHDWLSYHVAT
jgi:hypothetical protein